MDKEKNNVINISKFKIFLLKKVEEQIRGECFVACHILFNNIDQEIKCLSTYENKWPGSINHLLQTKYNIELGILNFPLNLLQVDYVFEIFQLKDIKLLKIGENNDDITIFKYYDMMKTTD